MTTAPALTAPALTAPALTALDFSGRPAALAAAPALAGEVPLRVVPAHTRLLSWDGNVMLVQPGEGLFRLDGAADPATCTQWRLDLSGIGPGWNSGPMAVTADGALWRCAADGGVEKEGDTGMAGTAVSAVGLPEGESLVQCFGVDGPLFELWRGRIIWRKQGPVPALLPHGASVFLEFNDAIHAIVRDSGRNLWSAPGPIAAFIGVVGNELWVNRGEGRLAALDVAAGTQVRTVDLPHNRAGEGRLDQRGLYRTLTGLRFQAFDLSAGGTQRVDREIQGSSTASGNLMAVAEDGRVAFIDDRGQLFLLDPSSDAPPLSLRTGLPAHAYPVIGAGGLYVLDTDRLLCFA